MPFEVGTSDSPISKRMRGRDGERMRREVGREKEVSTGKGEASGSAGD